MLKLSSIHKIHFTGIKGVGMTALACIARDYGMEITGSDVDDKFVTDEILASKGIADISDFSATKIEELKPDLIVFGVAHDGEENQEVVKANHLKIPTLSFAQALALFASGKDTITVSGVGGKTTTSAMLTTVLTSMGQNPSYMIGSGEVKSLDFPGAYHHEGKLFIAEADEYKSSVYDENPKFHYLDPKVVIIPNLAFDHPDVYRDENHTLETFKNYIEKVPSDGIVVINIDCKMCQRLLEISKPKARVITFGIDNTDSDYVIKDIVQSNGTTSFAVDGFQFHLPIPGKIYAASATAVILACHFFGFDYSSINAGLDKYQGVKRRFEKIFENENTVIYDDYAHHPEEIKRTLQIVKDNFETDVIAVFEPHTLSRTKSLFDEFASSFGECAQVIIPDIFSSAREKDDHSINSSDLVVKINQISNNAKYIASYEKVLDYLKNLNLNNKIIITLGAGNIYHVAQNLADYLKNK